MHTGSESAHKLLELLITKTMVSGKPKSSTVTLSYNELASANGQKPDNSNVDLHVEINLSWTPIEGLEEF